MSDRSAQATRPRADTSVLAAALAYAQHYRWPVHPCRWVTEDDDHKGKAPLTRRGCRDATTDADQIRAWWTRWPDAAIGIHCGRAGLVVIDLDVDKPLPESWRLPVVHDGEDVLALVADEIGEQYPWTRSARTPSGGVHLYYWAPEGVHMGPSTARIGPMIDVRAGESYVVGPPSVVDDKAYAPLDTQPIQPLPDWLTQLATPPPETSRASAATHPAPPPGTSALAALTGFVLDAKPGGRNTALHWAACRAADDIAAGRYTRDSAEAVLQQAADTIGLGAAEATKTIHSGLRSVPA